VKEVGQLLNEMRAAGVIRDYALFGAMAQMRYTEPVATLDADVLVAVPDPERPDVLNDVHEFCAARGFKADGESIRVGAWPVQLVPAFSALTQEAMERADTTDFEGVPFRVVRPEYLAVMALSVGRAKDFTRILALLESEKVDRAVIQQLARRHGLEEAWRRFEKRFLDA
jgi:hypothetical protein